MKLIKNDTANEFCPIQGVYMSLVGDGEDMTFIKIRIDPNSILPLHAHPNEQIGTCLEGTGWMTSNGVQYEINQGDTWTIPSGEEHMFKAGDTQIKIIEVWSPPREDYRTQAKQ